MGRALGVGAGWCYRAVAMKAIALALVLGTMVAGCQLVGGHSITGSGKVATRRVYVGPGQPLAAFKKIKLEGAFDIETKNGPQSDIIVTGDDNLIELVECSVSGDTLTVKTSTGYSTSHPLKVAVTLPDLQALSISGSGKAKVNGLSAQDAAFSIDGSGDILVTGTAKSASGSIEGSGDIDLSGLAAQKASASIDGSGTIRVNATDSVSASISGSGEILYRGAPKDLAKSIDGSGTIKSF